MCVREFGVCRKDFVVSGPGGGKSFRGAKSTVQGLHLEQEAGGRSHCHPCLPAAPAWPFLLAQHWPGSWGATSFYGLTGLGIKVQGLAQQMCRQACRLGGIWALWDWTARLPRAGSAAQKQLDCLVGPI